MIENLTSCWDMSSKMGALDCQPVEQSRKGVLPRPIKT